MYMFICVCDEFAVLGARARGASARRRLLFVPRTLATIPLVWCEPLGQVQGFSWQKRAAVEQSHGMELAGRRHRIRCIACHRTRRPPEMCVGHTCASSCTCASVSTWAAPHDIPHHFVQHRIISYHVISCSMVLYRCLQNKRPLQKHTLRLSTPFPKKYQC